MFLPPAPKIMWNAELTNRRKSIMIKHVESCRLRDRHSAVRFRQKGAKMKKKRLIVILAVVCLLAVGCTLIFILQHEHAEATGTDSKPVRVAFSLAEGSNQWSNAFYEELVAAAERTKMELIYDEPTENTAEWQRKNIAELLAQDVDYLIVLPHDTQMIDEVAAQAKAAGVRTILISSSKKADPRCDATVLIDFALEGRLCARILAELAGEQECRVLEILGPENSQIAAARSQGFREELAKHRNLKLTAHVQGSNSRISSNNAVAEYISSNYAAAPFDAVFACSDDDGLGALQALRNAGLRPGVDVSLLSINGTQDAMKAIAAGEYNATVRSGKFIGEVLFGIVGRMESGDFRSRYFILPSRVYSTQTDFYWLQEAMWA